MKTNNLKVCIGNGCGDFGQNQSFFRFMLYVIESLRSNGKIRTAECYEASLASFKRYRVDMDLSVDALTPSMMRDYEAYMQRRGLVPNTTSFYMRTLRAAYNRAVRNGLRSAPVPPFQDVYVGVDKTAKRALPLSQIKRILTLDLSDLPKYAFARDMFMLSFYLRGMSFIDMAYLRKCDLRGGHVVYRRRKTGTMLSIKWLPEMQSILDRYPSNPTHYLLPIITRQGLGERTLYRNIAYNINHRLRTVARLADIASPFTMYSARHSWATAAHSKGVPISVISEGMGHRSEQVTRIYLASICTPAVDRANYMIMQSLK